MNVHDGNNNKSVFVPIKGVMRPFEVIIGSQEIIVT